MELPVKSYVINVNPSRTPEEGAHSPSWPNGLIPYNHRPHHLTVNTSRLMTMNPPPGIDFAGLAVSAEARGGCADE
jgi:hypothetical protein